LPSRIAGTTNRSTSARLAPRPSSDSAPRRREEQHDRREHQREDDQRCAALEVVEGPGRPGDRRLPGRRLRRLGDADLVAGVQIGVEAAHRAQLELDALAGRAPLREPGCDQLAALLAEAGAGGLDDLVHLGLAAVHPEVAADLVPVVAGPEHHEADRCADRHDHRHRGEGALHAAGG
jgi:hypothetical protein